MLDKKDFKPVFNRLRKILHKFEARLVVTADKPGNYLMPVYIFPDLLKGASTGLRKRVQGKSCFNFTQIDEELFSELARLTRQGFEKLKQEKVF